MSSTGRFLLAVGIYFALHTLMRVAFSDSLELDEAEQVLFGQWLEWGYSSQPPLYTWLQKALFGIFGCSVLAIALLKNGLLFGLYTSTFLVARRVLGDPRRAMLAALSLLLMPPIAWESARDLTHTVLVAALVAMSFHSALGLTERTSLARYAGFGITLGLGLLSKHNFILHVTALFAALLWIPEGRRVVLDRRMPAAIGLALLLYAPHGWWLWHHHDSLSAGINKLASGGRGTTHPLLTLVSSTAAYLAPVLLIWALLFPDAIRNPFRKPADRPSVGTELLGRYFLILLALLASMVLLADTGRIKVRWLFPYLVLFPPLLFSMLPADRLDGRRFRAYRGIAGLSAFAVVALMFLRVPGAGWINQATDLNLPFPEFAENIRAAGFSEGIIIGHNAHIAGNFHHQFKERGTAFAPHADLPFPANPTSPILVVWEIEKSDRPSEKLLAFVRDRLHVDLAAVSPNYLSIPYRHSPRLQAKIGYIILSAPNRSAATRQR
jgi:4-amino-4-deoxy-L-arabinose transferase-like glycosyltransferase